MAEEDSGLCPPDRIDAVVARLHGNEADGLAALEDLLRSWPLDPRLHFLLGSVLAGSQRYDEGRRAMARAVEIAPEFELARFQLGFLDLTSGRAADALAVWTPLGRLAEDNPFRVLAEGLAHLSVDNFPEARRHLLRGMELNTANPLINADMQLVLDEIDRRSEHTAPAQEGLARDPSTAPPAEQEPEDGGTETASSAVDLLLNQSRWRNDTRH